LAEGDFFEEDEPVEPLLALLDESELTPLTGPCEFTRGAVTFNPAPVVQLCGQPGVARRGITWCEVIACDECYDCWRGNQEE
jgi:hypothetical protein